MDDIPLLLRSAARNVERILSHKARKIGLTSGQLTLLLMIDAKPLIIAKDLQKRYATEKPTMTRMLSDLKEKNLVVSSPGVDNLWRSKHYKLTPHGELVMKKGRVIHAELRVSVQSAISKRQGLIAQLEAIAGLLNGESA